MESFQLNDMMNHLDPINNTQTDDPIGNQQEKKKTGIESLPARR